jgi:hypothetical protein
MSQSRLLSAVESAANVGVGFGVALLSQLAIFPLFHIDVPLSSNLAIGAWFTAISLVRSYVIRRWFNGLRFAPASQGSHGAENDTFSDSLREQS